MCGNHLLEATYKQMKLINPTDGLKAPLSRSASVQRCVIGSATTQRPSSAGWACSDFKAQPEERLVEELLSSRRLPLRSAGIQCRARKEPPGRTGNTRNTDAFWVDSKQMNTSETEAKIVLVDDTFRSIFSRTFCFKLASLAGAIALWSHTAIKSQGAVIFTNTQRLNLMVSDHEELSSGVCGSYTICLIVHTLLLLWFLG